MCVALLKETINKLLCTSIFEVICQCFQISTPVKVTAITQPASETSQFTPTIAPTVAPLSSSDSEDNIPLSQLKQTCILLNKARKSLMKVCGSLCSDSSHICCHQKNSDDIIIDFDDQAFPFIRAFHKFAQLNRYYLAIFTSHLYLVIKLACILTD